MADENKDQEKTLGETAETKDQETTESKTKKKTKNTCTLLKNVKYGNTPYKAGEKIQIKEEDIEEFKKVGAIKVE